MNIMIHFVLRFSKRSRSAFYFLLSTYVLFAQSYLFQFPFYNETFHFSRFYVLYTACFIINKLILLYELWSGIIIFSLIFWDSLVYCVSIIYSNRTAFLIHSNSDICSTSGGLSYMQKIDLIPLLSVGNGTEIAFMMQLECAKKGGLKGGWEFASN